MRRNLLIIPRLRIDSFEQRNCATPRPQGVAQVPQVYPGPNFDPRRALGP